MTLSQLETWSEKITIVDFIVNILLVRLYADCLINFQSVEVMKRKTCQVSQTIL